MLTEMDLELLRESGWYENRRVDTKNYQAYLESRGYVVHSCVSEFLKEFGGLRIVFWHTNGVDDELNFDVAKSNGIIPANVKRDSAILKVELCPIGEFDEGFAYLAMDCNGNVYARYQDCMTREGSSPREAIASLLHDEIKPVIYGTRPTR